MAIMLDGTQLVSTTAKPASTKVTYKPPTQTQYNTSYNEAQRRAQQYQAEMQRRQQEAARQAQQQAAQNAYAQRMQAQADAYKKQQQAMQQTPQVQIPPTPTRAQQMMNSWQGVTMNMGPKEQQQQAQAQNAYAQRYQQQAQQYGQQNASPTKPYHPVTNPTGYKSGMDYVRTLPNDWRELMGNTLMQPNEWLRRRNAWEKQYGNIFVSETEWQKRNAAAPPGYMWTPFGTGYAKLDTSAQPTAPATDYGGYGDWGYPDYGGGGSTYTPKPPEWWVEMVQWRI